MLCCIKILYGDVSMRLPVKNSPKFSEVIEGPPTGLPEQTQGQDTERGAFICQPECAMFEVKQTELPARSDS